MLQIASMFLGVAMVIVGFRNWRKSVAEQYSLKPARALKSAQYRPMLGEKGAVSNALDADLQVVREYQISIALWRIVTVLGSLLAILGGLSLFHQLF